MTNQQKDNLMMEHVKRYEEDLLVRRILNGDSSFGHEIEDFYGLSTRYNFGGLGDPCNGRIYKLFEGNDASKKGKAPQNLIDVLGPFSKDGLDPNLLSYDSVRDDYLRFRDERKVRIGVGLTSMLGGGSISLYLLSDPQISYLGGLDGLIGIISLIGVMFFGISLIKAGPERNTSLGQYVDMHNSALGADDFMHKNK